MFQKLIFLGLAGATGALARYWLSGIVSRAAETFPLGTAVVNIVGCLLFGLFWAAFESRLSISPQVRTVVFIGFFGAFTTFSTFAYETVQMLAQSQYMWAAANILLQNTAALLAMLGGLAIGKYI